MKFTHPHFFYIFIPWALFCLILFFYQKSVLHWLRQNISENFLKRFTQYTPTRLFLHMALIFFVGASLIVALAEPYKNTMINNDLKTRNIFLVIDSSHSMAARDNETITKNNLAKETRFEVAKQIALDLLSAFKNDSVGLITFSGTSVTNSMPTRDHETLRTQLINLDFHMLQDTGSQFERLFDHMIALFQLYADDYTVILISDGEPVPEKQNVKTLLETLQIAAVPIYTIGVGSDYGQRIELFEPLEIYHDFTISKVQKTVFTKKNAKFLMTVSEKTSGRYFEFKDGIWVEDFVNAFQPAQSRYSFSHKGLGVNSEAHWPMMVFCFLFFLEMILFVPVWSKQKYFCVVLSLFFMPAFACDGGLRQANKKNNEGIDYFEMALFDKAKQSFQASSLMYSFSETPLANLAYLFVLQKEYRQAHEIYQRAMRLNPNEGKLHFNDGTVLFLWAEEELDPTGCFLKTTRQLYQQSLFRFETAKQKGIPAQQNIDYIKARLADLHQLKKSAKNCGKFSLDSQLKSESEWVSYSSLINNNRSDFSQGPTTSNEHPQPINSANLKKKSTQNQTPEIETMVPKKESVVDHPVNQMIKNNLIVDLTDEEKKIVQEYLIKIKKYHTQNRKFKQTVQSQRPQDIEKVDKDLLW